MRSTIPNKVASNGLTQPLAIVIGILLWVLIGWRVPCIEVAASAVAAILTTYVLMETNNRNALIRIRTRITSSVFWLGVSAMTFAFTLPYAMLTALCVSVSVGCLFSTYDGRQPVVSVFHSFAALTLAAVLCAPLWLCVPVYWLYLATYTRAMTSRVFTASLLGIMLALVLSLALACAVEGVDVCLSRAVSLYDSIASGGWLSRRVALWTDTYRSMAFDGYTVSWIVTLSGGLAGIRHYTQQTFDDKIRTRMLNYIIIAQWGVTQLLAVLMPWHLASLLPTLWLFTAPLLGHHIALGRTRLSTLWFFVSVLLYPLWVYLTLS